MRQLPAGAKIYSQFLTNVAVAWFTAGVIAPLINPRGEFNVYITALSVLACYLCLRIAIILKREKK